MLDIPSLAEEEILRLSKIVMLGGHYLFVVMLMSTL